MTRYLCIHGHFYQPPRESPWLESVELQDSAHPYHDWNERITAECYAPNARSRILDDAGWIRAIVNNYERMSFNFGPTLLSWMERNAPATYASVLDADRVSRERFSGHGSAIAQVYNHMILPLANRRDQRTQVVWGLRDFERRFGRPAEGMWLAETAVDTASLEALAEQGIAFTILAPHQAARVRRAGGGDWVDVRGGRIDPKRAYRIELPSGRAMTLFFYDGPCSRAVAFEHLLRDGKRFHDRLLSTFVHDRDEPQLMHIATDGETYGHHHRYGDMALAWALDHAEDGAHVTLTNYAEFLARHPPTHEVEIVEESSWSCAHGVERWRADCGCTTGGHSDWSQAWRAPLREALDRLRDALVEPWEREASRFLADPWRARDAYIDVVLDRSAESVRRFLGEHARAPLRPEERITTLKLLELQRQAMLMYTSCGWFFDELSRIETTQILRYAARAVQLGEETLGVRLEDGLRRDLAYARSNVAERRDGARLYDEIVLDDRVDLEKVGAHYALAAAFARPDERSRVYCYEVERRDLHEAASGRTRLVLGRGRITSTVTEEAAELAFGALHMGDHNLAGGVCHDPGPTAWEEMQRAVVAAFETGDLPGMIRAFDGAFGPPSYSLSSLFRDEQRRVTDAVLRSTLDAAEGIYRQIYDTNVRLMRFLTDMGQPLPASFRLAAELVLNSSIRRALGDDPIDLSRIEGCLEEARATGIHLATDELSFALQQNIERAMDRVEAEPEDPVRLAAVRDCLRLADEPAFELDLWRVKNAYYGMARSVLPRLAGRAGTGDDDWLRIFRDLGERLRVRVDD